MYFSIELIELNLICIKFKMNSCLSTSLYLHLIKLFCFCFSCPTVRQSDSQTVRQSDVLSSLMHLHFSQGHAAVTLHFISEQFVPCWMIYSRTFTDSNMLLRPAVLKELTTLFTFGGTKVFFLLTMFCHPQLNHNVYMHWYKGCNKPLFAFELPNILIN